MDTSKTYIEMCVCFEIQEQWKPKEGDCFSFVGDIHILSGYEIWALEKKELSDVDCWNEVITLMGGHFVDHWNECREGFVWLPRQGQIQEMMEIKTAEEFRNAIGGMLYERDRGGIYDNCADWLDVFDKQKTPEQLWLAFYMHEKHGKTWSGTKWKKK